MSDIVEWLKGHREMFDIRGPNYARIGEAIAEIERLRELATDLGVV